MCLCTCDCMVVCEYGFLNHRIIAKGWTKDLTTWHFFSPTVNIHVSQLVVQPWDGEHRWSMGFLTWLWAPCPSLALQHKVEGARGPWALLKGDDCLICIKLWLKSVINLHYVNLPTPILIQREHTSTCSECPLSVLNKARHLCFWKRHTDIQYWIENLTLVDSLSQVLVFAKSWNAHKIQGQEYDFILNIGRKLKKEITVGWTMQTFGPFTANKLFELQWNPKKMTDADLLQRREGMILKDRENGPELQRARKSEWAVREEEGSARSSVL